MPGDQLFEDYDPDMEDIFGHKNIMTPRRVTVTEQQKCDPLRKPKVELQGILVAEKQPVTAKHIEQRMKDDYGQVLDPKKYGCNTLDDLLQACSDTIVHQRRRDGVHVYMAKVSEANQDIVEMVQQQRTGNETKRAPKSFLTSGCTKAFGNHGASFRAYRGTKAVAKEDIPKAKGTPDQLKARNKLGPAKTVARLQNLADLLNECREEIGNPHPNEPGRKIVTLGSLAEKFKQVYGLPAWGKNMTESELHKLIDVPALSGILSFWRLRDNGDIFVELYQLETNNIADTKEEDIQLSFVEPQLGGVLTTIKPTTAEVIPAAEATPTEDIPAAEATPTDVLPTAEATPTEVLRTIELTPTEEQRNEVSAVAVAPPPEQPTASHTLSSIADPSFEDFSSIDGQSCNSSMLITEGENDGFFESGPGFGGNLQGRQQQPNSQNGARNGEMSEIAQRFGNTSFGLSSPTSAQQSHAGSVSNAGSVQGSVSGRTRGNKEDGAQTQSSAVQPMRPVHAAFGSRSIQPQNPVKILAEYIKRRGSTKFEALPEDDKVIVNFGRNVFKVYSEQPGEMMVRLVNPSIDTSSLEPNKGSLREPLEADFRWMTEASVHVKRGRRHLIKPVMFVAPRGFLLVISNLGEEDLDCDKMGLMEDLLRGAMDGAIQELTHKKVRPGMAAVYIYRQGAEIRYYRVLIVGAAHQNGDVMVLLADHNEQYLADVQLSHLFELPEKISFKNYAPNVIFATLFGVMGLSIEEQQNMWRNFDDEERKQFIVGYIPEDAARVLSVDLVLRDERGQIDWLSRIAKRRGAIGSTDADSDHLRRAPSNAYQAFGPNCIMDFVDYSAGQRTAIQTNGNRREEQSESEDDIAPTSEETITDDRGTAHSSLSTRSLNLFKLFDKLIADQQVVSVVAMSQFVRNIRDLNGNSEWNELVDYMVNIGRRNNIRL